MKKVLVVLAVVLTVIFSIQLIAFGGSAFSKDFSAEKQLAEWNKGNTLQAGSEGDAVAYLQHKLEELGYLADDVEYGVFDDTTKVAVLLFQTHEDIAVDGSVGPDTRKHLEEAEAITEDELNEVIAQYTDNTTITSSSEIKYGYGSAGRLIIPAVGINVALYYADGSNGQYYTDCQDSAALMYFSGNCEIADHNTQEFATLSYVTPGMEGYIEYADGSRVYIICSATSYGCNTGYELYDDYGSDAYGGWACAYTMYTCVNGWNNVFVCHWNYE